jgi:hypothetical protein
LETTVEVEVKGDGDITSPIFESPIGSVEHVDIDPNWELLETKILFLVLIFLTTGVGTAELVGLLATVKKPLNLIA